jgi:hypothetical protein
VEEKLLTIVTNDLKHVEAGLARMEANIAWLTRLGLGILAAIVALALKGN